MKTQRKTRDVFRLLKNEKGISFIAVVFAMIVLSTLGMGLGHMISAQALSSVAGIEADQAFYVADGGLQHTITKEFMYDLNYSDNVSPTGAPYGVDGIALGEGTYWVEYSNQSTTSIDLKITGKVGNNVRIIEQTVAMAIPVNYPVFSGGDISFDGNRSCIFFGLVCLPSGMLFGDVAAAGTITHPSHFYVYGTEAENQSVSLPEVDVQALVPDLTSTEHEGDLTISGYYDEDVHVTGDVTIEGGAIVNGNVIADGNMTISGNVLTFGTLAAGGDINGQLAQNSAFLAQDGPNGEVEPALMAGGDLNLEAAGLGTIVNGMIIVGGAASIHADLSQNEIWGEAIILNGGVFAGGDFSIYNERGFVLVNGDEDLVLALAQGGNLSLQQWREG